MEHQHLININLELTGKKIKKAIEESEYEEIELADYFKVSVRTIKYWKSGDRLPSLDNFFYLSKILDTNIENLISFEDEASKFDLSEELKSMSGIRPSPFMHYYRKKFKIRTVEDFIAFLPLYDEVVLNDVLYRISGESISYGTYMLEQFDYLYNEIGDKEARDKISLKLENNNGIWNTHNILAIVDAETYEMANMSSYYKQKKLKNYIKDLVRDDFKKNGLQINKFRQEWFNDLKSMND
ncbi:helix-turn-helix transcriptional regulator [Amedibacillus sp. YH-ame6]